MVLAHLLPPYLCGALELQVAYKRSQHLGPGLATILLTQAVQHVCQGEGSSRVACHYRDSPVHQLLHAWRRHLGVLHHQTS